MKYWTFDVCSLIADYPKNKRRLETLNEAVALAEKFYENPVGTSTRGDWEMYLKVARMRQEEYQLYCDMVTLGLNDLPEVERDVLRWWLIDGYDDDRIRVSCGIKNNIELQKIKKIAITKFANIAMPD